MAYWFEFEFVIFLFVIIVFAIAAFQDYQTREVTDFLWIILILASLPANLIRLLVYMPSYPQLIIIGILSIFSGIFLVLIMTYLGIWGGADLLAIFSLSLIMPYPISQSYLSSLQNLSLEALFPYSLTLILNSALLQIPIPIIIFWRNFIRYSKNPENYLEPTNSKTIDKFYSMFSGSPEKPADVILMHPWYYRFMESIKYPFKIEWRPFLISESFIRFSSEPLLRYNRYGDIRSRKNLIYYFNTQKSRKIYTLDVFSYSSSFNHNMKLYETEKDLFDQRKILDFLSKTRSKNQIWVQYSIPFVVFIFFGLIISFLYGNLLFLILSLL